MSPLPPDQEAFLVVYLGILNELRVYDSEKRIWSWKPHTWSRLMSEMSLLEEQVAVVDLRAVHTYRWQLEIAMLFLLSHPDENKLKQIQIRVKDVILEGLREHIADLSFDDAETRQKLHKVIEDCRNLVIRGIRGI